MGAQKEEAAISREEAAVGEDLVAQGHCRVILVRNLPAWGRELVDGQRLLWRYIIIPSSFLPFDGVRLQSQLGTLGVVQLEDPQRPKPADPHLL